MRPLLSPAMQDRTGKGKGLTVRRCRRRRQREGDAGKVPVEVRPVKNGGAAAGIVDVNGCLADMLDHHEMDEAHMRDQRQAERGQGCGLGSVCLRLEAPTSCYVA
ncbi:hypothetical protein NN6n1_01230 [Shinella zoogloeoides]